MEARDTVEAVKKILEEQQEEFDLELGESPINFSLSPIQKLKVASFAQMKAKEELLKSHIEESELLSLASNILERIMPNQVKDPSGSPSGELKKLINSVSTHFESLEKSAEVKVQKEFDDKRFNRLKCMITNEKSLLATCVKNIQSALSKGGKIYKSCFSLSKLTKENEKKIKDHEKQLAAIYYAFDPLIVSVGKQEG